ncbi:MerR family transcriptional regulator [Christensenellaceae bacterium]|nr:MerR family transcriptional regulator [Christensenellaceae bacterium]BDF60414.1 MerR family transcriptional regulator [Christensenellaceae bacterium]
MHGTTFSKDKIMNYTIGKFAAQTGISAPLLRYYERQGFLKAERDNAGRRQFSGDDAKWAGLIRLLSDTGMPKEQIREYARLRQKGEKTLPLRLKILEDHRRMAEEEKTKLEKNLQRLRDEIVRGQERTTRQNRKK